MADCRRFLRSGQGAGTRQFIVSKLQLSAAEEAEMRATFWYRDALLKRLGGRVEDDAHGRLRLRSAVARFLFAAW